MNWCRLPSTSFYGRNFARFESGPLFSNVVNSTKRLQIIMQKKAAQVFGKQPRAALCSREASSCLFICGVKLK
jgi:hypothetical protein